MRCFLHRLVAFLLLHCSRSSATCVSSYRHHGTRSLTTAFELGVFRHPMKNASNGARRHFWKRDEAVLLVREGSIVVGASRYEPRLRCIINMCSHHRRSGTSESEHRYMQLVSARSGDDPSLAANVGELEAHLYSSCDLNTHHNNIVQMRLRCVAVAPPTCNHTLHHTRRTAPFSTLSLDQVYFLCASPQPLLEVIHIHPRGSPRPHHGERRVVPRGGAHAASVVPA